MASLLAAPTTLSLAWSSQDVVRTAKIAAKAPLPVARAAPRRLVCVASERSVHGEPKAKVVVRVALGGDHRENITVESQGGEVYWVPLGKPLGIVFKESAAGDIVVEEVQHGGHAEHAPIHKVRAGDRLLATTARASAEGGAKFATEPVVLQASGERFETVMAAISSNASYGGNVILVLERPEECDL